MKQKQKTQTPEEFVAALQHQIDDLTAENIMLTEENDGLKRRLLSHARMKTAENGSLLVRGRENDLYPNEIYEVLIDLLQEVRSQVKTGTRRADILDDLLSANSSDGIPQKKARELKDILKGYKALDAATRRKLNDIGIDVSEQQKKHYKLRYYGDTRYNASMPCSGSDRESGGRNLAAELIKKFF